MAESATAQQTDTAATKKKLHLNHQQIQKKFHTERSTNQYLSNDGSYHVPEPKEYYVPPFNGQKSLDEAIAAYKEGARESRFFQILGEIAPYVYNRFEFGVYKINDLPIVARDNPLFQSYHSPAKSK